MFDDWKERVDNSLATAAALGAGQTIGVLRNVAGAVYTDEKRAVGRYVRRVAVFNGRVWKLKSEPAVYGVAFDDNGKPYFARASNG